MILDTGFRCHELQTLNFFPFAISQSIEELYNISGYSGPVKSNLSSIHYSGFSGVIGKGTFYPSSGNLDAYTRAYWCVKSWSLTTKIYRTEDAGIVTCNADINDPLLLPIFPPYDVFTYCVIGSDLGDPTRKGLPEISTKILTTQDYCSHGSTQYNENPLGICPTENYPFVKNTNICVPLNPIQKFNDLLCRQNGFCWVPSLDQIKEFNSGISNRIDNPYRYDFTQFRVFSTLPIPPYDCGGASVAPNKATSIFSLSLMNPEVLGYSGLCVRPTETEIPKFQEYEVFGYCGKSGEVLTNNYGEVTGYGINPKLSGINTPCMFDINTGHGNWKVEGKYKEEPFFPFIFFEMILKNNLNISQSDLCPIKDTISTILMRNDQKVVGRFKIYDMPITGKNTIQNRENRIIAEIPLFGSTTSQLMDIDVELEPLEFWINQTGKPTY